MTTSPAQANGIASRGLARLQAQPVESTPAGAAWPAPAPPGSAVELDPEAPAVLSTTEPPVPEAPPVPPKESPAPDAGLLPPAPALPASSAPPPDASVPASAAEPLVKMSSRV